MVDVVATAVAQFRNKPTPGSSDCLVVEVARKAGQHILARISRLTV
jgi:hypothetical protein